jgi:uncharacterized OsmC-like protein
MTLKDIAVALERVESAFRRRPAAGLHEDAPVTSRWAGGTRVVSTHPDGAAVVTDMPVELGGSGDQVTPGWLLRAALASCATTRIVMAAAVEGIELSSLEVDASSRSDARGLLGMTESDGSPVPAEARDVEMTVRIAAVGRSPERLRALVDGCNCFSPVSQTLRNAVPVVAHIQVAAG